MLNRTRKKGIKELLWSCGRSNAWYRAADDKVSIFGRDADREQMIPQQIAFAEYLNKECPLERAVDFCQRKGISITGHLCMNRHYGSTAGNCFTSLLARDERLHECGKDGKRDQTRLSFGTPEYREERLAFIRDILRHDVDGICLDFVRQPPILRYHPTLVDGYRSEMGIDPREITLRNKAAAHVTKYAKTEQEQFLHWCSWRAGILTDFMRSVRRMLRDSELEKGRKLPLTVRITDDGFVANLIAGIDIVKWCEEGIVDRVILDKLQWIHGIWTHDARPYTELGRRTGVEIIGGVNTYPVEDGWLFNPVSIAMKVKEQYDAGVSGIALYESNQTVCEPRLNDLIPALYDYSALSVYLDDKEIQEKWPVNGLNANCGMDNHSGHNGFTLNTV